MNHVAPRRARTRAPRIAVGVFACLALGVLSSACGDDDDSATTDAPAATAGSDSTEASLAPAGDVCADREALRASVTALTSVDLRAEGTNGLSAAIDAVKADLAALRTSAGSELQPQVDAVQTALDEVQTAVGDLGSGGAVAAVAAVTNLGSAARTLLDQVQDGACGSTTTT